jgi:hypothetical protein
MAKGQKEEDQEEFKTTTICLFLIAFSLFFLGMTLFISRLSVIIAFKLLVDIFLNVMMHVIYFLNKIYPKIYIC